MKVSALIPVKTFRNAKQRLSPLLGSADRELLAEVMFRDALRQVMQARGLASTYVVTGDARVSEISHSFGAQVVREKVERGETEAVEFAFEELKRRGCHVVLVIPGDMPLVRSADIEHLLKQLPEGDLSSPFALLVPSHDRMGTNALLLSPPGVIKLRFGYDSFSYHLGQVAAKGLPLRVLENERLALDIDEPRDLERFLSFGSEDGETHRTALKMIAAQEAEKNRRSG